MQNNSLIQAYSEGSMRKLAYKVTISFDKSYVSGTTFFKVGNSGSQIGGTDFIPGSGSVVQEWDKYQYVDYTDRVIDIQKERNMEEYSSVTMGFGDIVFNNYDDFFTPGSGSSVSSNVLTGRPIRIWEGFEDQIIPTFIGVTDGTPVIDEQDKTATFHIVDFLYTLLNKNLDTIELSTNVRTDEALQAVFENAGLTAAQLSLDRGFNTLDQFSVEKGRTLQEVVTQLMEAEGGRLYMDEQGVITFKNRQNYLSDPVMRFDMYHNIIRASRTREDSIINVVEINSDIRTLQANKKIYESGSATLVPAGDSVEIWAELSDPVSTVDAPVYIDSATTSSFTVNTLEDGTGSADTSVTLTANSQFSRSYKMTFTNSSTLNLYITNIQLYGTPYTVTDSIFVREEDTTSVGKYEEHLLRIENDYIQNQSDAETKANIILDDYSTYASVGEIEVKGTPALQLDDPIIVDIYGRIQLSKITRIQTRMSVNGFNQVLRYKIFNPRIYFKVGNGGSLIGGTDYISF